jgi:hypothetical protein
VQGRLDHRVAHRFDLFRVQSVSANVLKLAQVRIEVLFRGRTGRGQGVGLVGGFDVVPENGDDVAPKVLVVRAKAGPRAPAATSDPSSAADVLEILNENKFMFNKIC